MEMRDLILWGRQSSNAPRFHDDDRTTPLLGREVNWLSENLFRRPAPELGGNALSLLAATTPDWRSQGSPGIRA